MRGCVAIRRHHPVDRRLQRRRCRREPQADRVQRGIGLRREMRGHLVDLRGNEPRGGAAVARRLAADQVVGLDAGRAFVDRDDPRVAVVLRGAGLLDEAHAAVHLHAERRHFLRRLRAPALDDRDHQVDERLVLRARVAASGRVTRIVDGRGRDVADGAHRFGVCAHRHQHPADVRMIDDRTRLGRLLSARRLALHAIARVCDRALVRALGHARRLPCPPRSAPDSS